MSKVWEWPVHLRWSDADRQGHINNGKFATYAEDARIEWFQRMPGRQVGTPSGSLILARQEIDYHRQVKTEDENLEMVMRCRILKIGTTSARLSQQLFGRDDAKPAAGIECVIVNFDYAAGMTMPWTDEQREWLAEHLIDGA